MLEMPVVLMGTGAMLQRTGQATTTTLTRSQAIGTLTRTSPRSSPTLRRGDGQAGTLRRTALPRDPDLR